MKMFRCELIDKGIVIERFFKRGESAQVITGQLEGFCWPKGKWVIKECEPDSYKE